MSTDQVSRYTVIASLPARRLALIILAGLICLFPAACRQSHNPPTPEATAAGSPAATPQVEATRVKPQKGGSLVAAIPEQPDSLNFSLATLPSAFWILSALDARLIRVTADGSYEPDLLAEVPSVANGGISPDGLTWTLHFRTRLYWSDGERLDAADLKFTWAMMVDSAYPARDRSGWTDISGISVSGEQLTAVLTLRQPDPALIDEILAGGSDDGHGMLLPAHVLRDIPPSQIPDAGYGGTEHIGSGPFKLAKWISGEQLVIERNDNYAGHPALLDRIVFRVISDSRAQLHALDDGEIDLAPYLPEANLATLDRLTKVQSVSTPMAGAVDLLGFNLHNPADLSEPSPVLSDPAVRAAVELAFNRAAAAQLVAPNTPVVETPLAYTGWEDPTIDVAPYDPRRAAALLDASGWAMQPDGVRARGSVRLTFTNTTLAGEDPQAMLRRQIQEQLIHDLAAVGIQVVPRNLPAPELASALSARSFESVDLWNDTRSGVAEFIWRFSSGQSGGGNIMGYRSATVDQALASATTAGSADLRRRFLDLAQTQVHADLPVITLFAHQEIDASRTHVHGLDPGSTSGLWWNVETWWLDREQDSP